MFKQVKSALFWYYLYKFRRRVLLIAFLIFTALFANAIYTDVVEYLTLKEKLEFLEIALLSKWFIVIFNLLFSIYLVLGIFKLNNKEKIKKEEKKKKVPIYEKKEKKKEAKFTKREEEFLNKDILKNKADSLLKR